MLLSVFLGALTMSDLVPSEREATVIEGCKIWVSARGADSPVVHRIGEDGLCFFGNTTDEAAKAFVETLTAIDVNTPLFVVLRSGGGEINAAMAMAEALVPRQTTVVAQRQCASSCANYLFLAGDRRVVAPGTLLAYHGGIFAQPESYWEAMRQDFSQRMNATDLEASMTASRDYATNSLQRQNAFLASVDVDPGLFEWMQSLNDLSPEERLANCPVPGAGLIVFSDAVLAERGVVVHQNDGPKGDAELAAELGSSAGIACYWD